MTSLVPESKLTLHTVLHLSVSHRPGPCPSIVARNKRWGGGLEDLTLAEPLLCPPPLSLVFPTPPPPPLGSSLPAQVPPALPEPQWQYEISHLKKRSQIFDLDACTEDASSQLWVPRLPTPCSWRRHMPQWVQTARESALQHGWKRSQMADVQCLVWGRARWWGVSWGGKRLLFFLSRQMVLRIWQAHLLFFFPFLTWIPKCLAMIKWLLFLGGSQCSPRFWTQGCLQFN